MAATHPSFAPASTGGSKPRSFCTACGIAQSVAAGYPCEPRNRAAIEARVPASDRVEVERCYFCAEAWPCTARTQTGAHARSPEFNVRYARS